MWIPPSPSWHMVTGLLLLQGIATKAFIHATCNSNSTSLNVRPLPAVLQPLLSSEGVLGFLVKVKHSNGCHPIQGPSSTSSDFAVLLCHQHNCSFSIQVLHTQQASFLTAPRHNATSPTLKDVLGKPGTQWHIYIPAAFTEKDKSTFLKHLHCSRKSVSVILGPDYLHFPLKDASRVIYLGSRNSCQCLITLPGSCSEITILYTCWIICLPVSALIATLLIEKYISQCKKRKIRRNLFLQEFEREPANISFTSSKYQECAICLDRYMEYDSVKVLSCSHAFHSRCIDLWHLTQARCKTCPLCMQKVMVVTRLQAVRLWKDGMRENNWMLWTGKETAIDNQPQCLLLPQWQSPHF